MTDKNQESIEALRKEVHTIIASLSPRDAQVLQARLNMRLANQSNEAEESTLNALLQELVRSKLKKQ